ncbi:MAG TPA: MBL fold metallo-hydrolase [Alphaproteobacteria bacterium]|nr:MBL fold metallo-hydrolase [Alphaproteobacteria bacterium]
MDQYSPRISRFRPAGARRVPEDAPAAAGRPEHHLPNGLFRNPPGSPQRDVDMRTLLRYLGRMARNSRKPVIAPADHVIPERRAIAGLKILNGADSLTWLGHAAFLIRLAGKTILTDPYLSDYAGPGRLGPKRFVKSGIAAQNLPPIDILLISHNHYDHLDEVTLRHLPHKDHIQVVAPLRLGEFFLRRGFQRVVELDWRQEYSQDGVCITSLPVVHWSRRHTRDTNRTLWAGYGLRGAGQHLFFGGDSAYGKIFRHLGESFGPFDTAMIGIGGYAPQEIMHASHATPEEAVQIGRDIGARRIAAMHWGTVQLTEEPPFEPPQRFLAAGRAGGYADEDLWVMKIGETRPLFPAQRSN